MNKENKVIYKKDCFIRLNFKQIIDLLLLLLDILGLVITIDGSLCLCPRRVV